MLFRDISNKERNALRKQIYSMIDDGWEPEEIASELEISKHIVLEHYKSR